MYFLDATEANDVKYASKYATNASNAFVRNSTEPTANKPTQL